MKRSQHQGVFPATDEMTLEIAHATGVAGIDRLAKHLGLPLSFEAMNAFRSPQPPSTPVSASRSVAQIWCGTRMTSPRISLTTTYTCLIAGCCATDIYRPPFPFNSGFIYRGSYFCTTLSTTNTQYTHQQSNSIHPHPHPLQRHHEQQLGQRGHWCGQDRHRNSWEHRIWCV